jgi:hypothetical protein
MASDRARLSEILYACNHVVTDKSAVLKSIPAYHIILYHINTAKGVYDYDPCFKKDLSHQIQVLVLRTIVPTFFISRLVHPHRHTISPTFTAVMMPVSRASLVISLLALFFSSLAQGHAQDPNHHLNSRDDLSSDSADPIPLSTREHWMRRAAGSLADLNNGSPCPFAAFGCVIVNHSAVATGRGGVADVQLGLELGSEVCVGANAIVKEGNPTLHGE